MTANDDLVRKLIDLIKRDFKNRTRGIDIDRIQYLEKIGPRFSVEAKAVVRFFKRSGTRKYALSIRKHRNGWSVRTMTGRELRRTTSNAPEDAFELLVLATLNDI